MTRALLFFFVAAGIYSLWEKTSIPGAIALTHAELRDALRESPKSSHSHPPQSGESHGKLQEKLLNPSLTQALEQAVDRLQGGKAMPDLFGVRMDAAAIKEAMENLPHEVVEVLKATPEKTPTILLQSMDSLDLSARREKRNLLVYALSLQTEAKSDLQSLALRVLETPTSLQLALPDEEELLELACQLLENSQMPKQEKLSLFHQIKDLHPSAAAQQLLKRYIATE